MKKILIILICILFILGTVVSLSKDNLARYLIQKEIDSLGVQINIEKIHVSILHTLIQARDIVIYNPPEFQEKVMAEVPELFIDFVLYDFLIGKLHFNEIRLNLSNLYIETTKDNKTNLDGLNIGDGEETKTAKGYKIDKLVLTLGHVKSADYSKGIMPQIIEVDMGIENEVFNNVTDISGIIDIIYAKIVSNNLLKLVVGSVTRSGINVVTKPVETVGKGVGVVGQGAGKVGQSVGTGVSKVGQGFGKVAETIFPFGKKSDTQNTENSN